MRKVAHYLEKEDVVSSQNSKKHEDSLLMPRLGEKGQRLFVEVLVGKGKPHGTAPVSRGYGWYFENSKGKCQEGLTVTRNFWRVGY